ncbi:hypothetical protein O181_115371 [Austropuccinia psidii MF-1]|uniref:BED-type domain-containing protein n=1 Tax=Austropuccinia psidii MF-1 TaxID=1389203 RepID=A0A9Q3K815_9BASI|nr:hypothetical protein [Austropuccinia psidii MF-1]
MRTPFPTLVRTTGIFGNLFLPRTPFNPGPSGLVGAPGISFSTTKSPTVQAGQAEETTQASISEPAPLLKRLWVWVYFSDVDERHVQCNVTDRFGKICKKNLKRDRTGSTKSMGLHLNHIHRIMKPSGNAVANATSGTLDKFLQPRNLKKNLTSKTLKTTLIYFISDCDLPLSITESESFRALLELCNPSIINILVRRTALTGHLSNLFYFRQEHILKIISPNSGFVSFTTNSWTSPNVTAFMAVTVHFMDSNSNLKSILLGLNEIEGNHSGLSLAHCFIEILHQYETENTIMCITTDNASVNNQMVQEIENISPTFKAETHAIGCMAHIIHLAARNGLNALGHRGSSDIEVKKQSSELIAPMAISNLINPPDG